MIKVLVKKQSYYPVSTIVIKRHTAEFLKARGIVSDSLVSVAIVGENKMIELSKKYLKDNLHHDVLSFTESEVIRNFVYPPIGNLYLGEVVICYQEAFKAAKKENKRMEEKVLELLDHGLMHLLGFHHR